MSEREARERASAEAAELRREAEQRLQSKKAAPVAAAPETDVRALVHELQVHQIELEMQNEDLKRAQAAAQAASEKYFDLFDFAPVGYFLWDHEGRIVEVNLAGAMLLGLDRGMVMKKKFGQFVAAEHRAALADFCCRLSQTDTMQTCEVKILKAAQPIDVLLEGIAAHDRQRKERLCLAAAIDISQQKRADELAAANQALEAEIAARKGAEEAMKAAKHSAEQAKAVAEQANRDKDHFLAVLSHELRTPLMPVVMGLSMLQDRSDLDPTMREALEMVRHHVELEARLVDDLLDVSRIARGKVELSRGPVELCTVLHRAVAICQPDIESRNLCFSVDLGPAAPYWVEADMPRLEQVFWNLLKNAIKFTPHGGCVAIRCRPDEKHVIAEVSDSGIGIESEALSRIFNAFEQAQRSITQQFGGLGLGLAISKALVELHGGQIEVSSEGLGKGATFRVRLPLTAPAGRPPASAPVAVPRRAGRPLHILLVEDHGITAKILRTVLTSDGHTVESAPDVATALELAGRQAFDLLVSDLGLPDGSGQDLMRELRARGHKFPGIALSGYGQEEDILRSREAGFAAHLTKPASRETVIEAIAEK
jgi:two-component system CheB/CheR fusion protein